jgi:superfamily II DNA/RNA helicase
VSTFGQIFANMSGRAALKLDKLRVFVLDEADTFFLDNKHKEELDTFVATVNELKNKVQFVFFSATYEKHVGIEISKIIKDAIQITMKVESIKLDNVQ